MFPKLDYRTRLDLILGLILAGEVIKSPKIRGNFANRALNTLSPNICNRFESNRQEINWFGPKNTRYFRHGLKCPWTCPLSKTTIVNFFGLNRFNSLSEFRDFTFYLRYISRQFLDVLDLTNYIYISITYYTVSKQKFEFWQRFSA